METNKVGRPTDYTKELADKICEEISIGKSLRAVCREETYPAMSSVFKWLREHEEFTEQYRHACDERSEAHHEELLSHGDEAVILAETVDPKASGAVVNAMKLKSDNMKWSMARMKPKKYGDKVDVTSAGEKIQGNSIILSDFKNEANSK